MTAAIRPLVLAMVPMLTTIAPGAQPTGTGSISGVVTDDRGARLVAARVGLVDHLGTTWRTMLTDTDGRFILDAIPPGRYAVGVMKTGYGPVTFGQIRPGGEGVIVPIRSGEARRIAVVLPRGATISGVVRDEFGRAIAGAWVRAHPSKSVTGGSLYGTQGRTNSQGEYRLWGLPPGSFVVAAFHDHRHGEEFVLNDPHRRPRTMVFAPVFHPAARSWDAAVPVVVHPGAHAGGVDIALTPVPSGRVDGVVVNSTNATLEQGTIRIEAAGETMFHDVPRARVDRDDRFSFTGIAAGRHTLTFESLVSRAASPEQSVNYWGLAEVVVKADETATPTLHVVEGAKMSGRLEFVGPAQLDDAGRFWFQVVTVTGPFARYTRGGYGERRDGQLFSDAGLPPGGQSVVLGGAPSGWWLASALAGDRDILDFPIDLVSGQHLQNVRLIFTSEQSGLSGGVFDASGTPRFDHEVIVFPMDRRYWVPNGRRIRIVQPDLDGRFEAAQLPPGDYAVAPNRGADLDVTRDPARTLERLAPVAVPVTVRNGAIARQNVTVR